MATAAQVAADPAPAGSTDTIMSNPLATAPKPQDAPGANAAEDTADGAEIVVTGTSIRGVAPTGSSLIAVSRNDITSTSVNSISQLLAKVPQLGNFNRTAGLTLNNAGASPGPLIHGIVGGTLTLLNGHRVPIGGPTALGIDPAIVPLLAVERVEIVPDGASSVYGADAVAGVVNLITRHDLDGIEAAGRYGFDGGGFHTYSLAAAAGQRWSSGSAMVAFEHQGRSILKGGDRSFTALDLRPRGGIDRRLATCTPGTITVGGTPYALPALLPDTTTLCDNGVQSTLIPQEVRNSVYGNFRQEIGDRIELNGELLYSRNLQHLSQVTAAGTVLTVTSTNPYYIQVPGTPVGATQSVTYFPFPAFGASIERYRARSLDASLSARVDLGDRWNLTLRGDGGTERDLRTNSGPSVVALQAAASGTTVATALNPYGIGAPTAPQVLAAARGTFGFNRTAYDLMEGQAKIDGPLFSLPGGDVKIAFGGEYRRETIRQQYQVNSAAAISRSDGTRKVASAFGELFVPIVGPGNAFWGVQQLNLSVSGRYDHYNDVGSTTNPKIGVSWTPIDGVVARGSYGTSFNAPNLGDTYSVDGSLLAAPAIFGPALGNIILIFGGNPNLEPQTAKTWSAGVDIAPRMLPGLKISGTYFNVDYRNLIQIASPDGVVACASGLGACDPALLRFITRNPTPAQLSALLALGLPATGPFITPVGTILDGRRQNLGVQKTAGVDFNLAYTLSAAGNSYTASVGGTRLTKLDSAPTATSALTSVLMRTPKLRLRGNVSAVVGRLNAALFANYTDTYGNIRVNPIQPVNSFTTIDAHLGYRFGLAGGRQNLELTLDAENLFDRDPPFVDTDQLNVAGFSSDNASITGRIVSVGFRMKL